VAALGRATCHADVNMGPVCADINMGPVSADVSMVNANVSVNQVNVDPVNGSAGPTGPWPHLSASSQGLTCGTHVSVLG